MTWMLLLDAWTLAAPVAWAVDRWWGEPPARWHPVVGMGRWLNTVGAPWPQRPAWQALVGGALAWWVGAGVCVALAEGLVRLLAGWSSAPDPLWRQALTLVALGVLLKPLLAWRMLRDEVEAVEAALTESLPAGRARLARLVSRDTQSLTALEVRESALESLSENLNDSWVAPLFWFAVAGLPGAALYRFANTADAMWGYRGRWEWAGKWAARADDVLSWVPARLTAGLLALAHGRWPHGLQRQARQTPSPNSGWPMAALALLLNVQLRKPGVYALNPEGQAASPACVPAAVRLCERAVLWSLVFMVLLAVLQGLGVRLRP
ncbi:MAG: adenosylcobinamide-phosphate synthase CbiB [Pseudomonadota bacterium]